MLKAAVVGVGSMGRNHARIYDMLPSTKLVAVSDINEGLAEDAAKRYNTKAYKDYLELLDNEELDIVSIVVPTKFHKEVAVAFIEKGVHVLLEKPIALDEQEAREIIDAAGQNKVVLMVGHIERFNPAIIELKKRIEDDELGEIYKIDVERIGPFPHRIDDVGVIIDLSVHDIDVINYIMDSKITRVYCETQQRLHPKCEDSLTAILKYENGALAILNINYLSPKKIRQISFFGEKGMFKVNYISQELTFCENPSYNNDKVTGNFESVSEGKEKVIDVHKKEPLLAEIESFVRCIKDKTGSPVSGESALLALETANDLKKYEKRD